MKYLKITTAMLAALSISACSSGSGTDTASYSTNDATEISIAGKIQAGLDDNTLTDTFVLPTTGEATYAGVMVLPDPSASGSLLGDSEMTVDFATYDVTGEAGNFTNSVDEAWRGSLEIDGNFGTTVNVTGTLETGELAADVVETIYVAEASLAGHTNYGSTAGGEQTPEYITGWLEGTANTEGAVEILDGSNTSYSGELQP